MRVQTLNDALNQSSFPLMLDFIFAEHIFVSGFLALGIILTHLVDDIYSFMHFCMISNAFRCIFLFFHLKAFHETLKTTIYKSVSP